MKVDDGKKQSARDRASAWYYANRERAVANVAAYRVANPDKVRECIAKSRDVEKKRASDAAHYQANRRHRRDGQLAWRQANPEKKRASNAKGEARRRAAKLRRTVAWELELTDLVETEATHLCQLRGAATGVKWELDHVVPLLGRRVSGLHTWRNFAVITQAANRAKGNTFEVA